MVLFREGWSERELCLLLTRVDVWGWEDGGREKRKEEYLIRSRSAELRSSKKGCNGVVVEAEVGLELVVELAGAIVRWCLSCGGYYSGLVN